MKETGLEQALSGDAHLVAPAPEALRTARRARGLTQAQLARALGLNATKVSQWETGIQAPPTALLPRLRETLGDRLFAQSTLPGMSGEPADPPLSPPSSRPITPGSVAREASGPAAPDAALHATLFQAADKLRQDMDAAEYKHVVLNLVFLRALGEPGWQGNGILDIPERCMWSYLARCSGAANFGQILDQAVAAIEESNSPLRGTLFKGFGDLPIQRSGRLGELFTLLSSIPVPTGREGRDLLGEIYEYCLESFARAEGHRGGQFYTPRCVVRLLVAMLEPYQGVVYDPCCGSGGMFVQCERFLEAHGTCGRLSIFGQESNRTTWRLARMNLALHGLVGDVGGHEADTFLQDLHPNLKADYILSNPPFNAKDWAGDRLRADPRWRFGAPPVGNANYAWLQHMLYHLKTDGTAAVVLANGALTSDQSGEGDIRKALIEEDVVDAIISLPDRLFFSTQIPVSVWCLSLGKAHGARRRAGEVLFVDGSSLGVAVDRTHRALTNQDVGAIAGTYRRFRGEGRDAEYADEPGFCRSVATAEVRNHRYALVPGRYVGFKAQRRRADEMERLALELDAVGSWLARFRGATDAAQAVLLGLRRGLRNG